MLDITRPVDQDESAGPALVQRAYLSHTGEERPMVFGAYRHAATDASGEELASLLPANGLYVTHRYFPGPVLSQPIGAGSSKSGLTALFHCSFWPGDVQAIVAYVGPPDVRA